MDFVDKVGWIANPHERAARVDVVVELGVIVFEIDQRNMEQHPKARFKVVVDFMRFKSTFE